MSTINNNNNNNNKNKKGTKCCVDQKLEHVITARSPSQTKHGYVMITIMNSRYFSLCHFRETLKHMLDYIANITKGF